MSIIIVKNVVKQFVIGTDMCALHGLQLMKYQMEKHGWSREQWDEFYEVYKNNLNNIVYDPNK